MTRVKAQCDVDVREYRLQGAVKGLHVVEGHPCLCRHGGLGHAFLPEVSDVEFSVNQRTSIPLQIVGSRILVFS